MFVFAVDLLRNTAKFTAKQTAPEKHDQCTVQRHSPHGYNRFAKGTKGLLRFCGKDNAKMERERGKCNIRAASSGFRLTSAEQRERTCSSTDAPCRLRAAQHSGLAHSPVREARSQPELTSSSIAGKNPHAGGKIAAIPTANIRKYTTNPQS